MRMGSLGSLDDAHLKALRSALEQYLNTPAISSGGPDPNSAIYATLLQEVVKEQQTRDYNAWVAAGKPGGWDYNPRFSLGPNLIPPKKKDEP